MNRLINVVIVVSCVVLAGSYFLPTEVTWSPFDAWQGYYIGEEFVADFNMALADTFPFAVGVVVLIAWALSRRPTASVAVLVIFTVSWTASLTVAVARIVRIPNSDFRMLWLALAVLLIPTVLIVGILFLRKYPRTTASVILGALLAVSSALYQSCLIAWYLLEDKLLLNVGSVTGMTGAVVLFVGLLVKKESFLLRSSPKTR